eukprot:g14948.t1
MFQQMPTGAGRGNNSQGQGMQSQQQMGQQGGQQQMGNMMGGQFVALPGGMGQNVGMAGMGAMPKFGGAQVVPMMVPAGQFPQGFMPQGMQGNMQGMQGMGDGMMMQNQMMQQGLRRVSRHGRPRRMSRGSEACDRTFGWRRIQAELLQHALRLSELEARQGHMAGALMADYPAPSSEGSPQEEALERARLREEQDAEYEMELQDFGGAITVELSPRHELPQFTEYLGGLLVRLVVSGEGGQDITDRDMAFELSQRLLSDSVCVFLNRVEQLGRCSNLEVVQTHPFPVLRFSFLRVTWMRAMSLPGKMKLRVSDLSGSGFSAGEALPAGFADMNSVQKFAICAAAASASKELLEQSMTSEIVAETTASQYMVVLPPPETVTVGSMFLVRLKVTTASGGPVRDVRVRVGIKSLTTTAPGRTSPGLLQSLAVQGNSLGVVSTGNIKLDPLTTVRSSDGSGIIGFPLTVLKAGSGTYQLQFQPDVPDGKIVLTTSAFKVENPITAISSSSRISEMKIPKFGTSVPVPVAPQFCIETATNESLQQMDKDGIRISIVLRLKAAPEERESAAMSLVAQAKRDANEQAQRIANDMATRLAQTPNTAMRRAVDTMVARANSKAKGMFAGMSEEFAEACFATPAKLLQTGDPAVMVNFGNATVDFVGEQAPSLAEALGMDPTALDPTQSLNQFTEVLMSAGAALTPAREMAVEGSWELTLNDLDFKGGCTYEPNQSLVFPFKEGMDYSFSLSVNGVEGPSEPFKVLLIPADPVDLAFNWFLSAVAAIVGVVLLTTNVTLHHWAWFVIAMLCTLGMCIGLPWMTLHKDQSPTFVL